MAFQMKNKGNGLLSQETWFKPLFRSQVKISLVLLSFLTFVLLTQLPLIQGQWGVTGSPGSKAGCPRLPRERILPLLLQHSALLCVGMEKKGNPKGDEKKEGRTQGSHWFWQYEKPVSFHYPGLLVFLMGSNHIEAEQYFWLLKVKCLLMCLGSLQTMHNICSFSLPTHTTKWMSKIIL